MRMLSAQLPYLATMTLRSDYLGRLQQETRLAAPFEQFSLKPMPLERVRDIVLGPARLAGMTVDEALVTEMMADARTDDALPLLAFALRELYDRSVDKRAAQNNTEAYRAMGDAQAQLSPLENAVRRKADEVLSAANPTAEDLQALKEAFIPAMVRVNAEGEYVRRPAAMADLPSRACGSDRSPGQSVPADGAPGTRRGAGGGGARSVAAQMATAAGTGWTRRGSFSSARSSWTRICSTGRGPRQSRGRKRCCGDSNWRGRKPGSRQSRGN